MIKIKKNLPQTVERALNILETFESSGTPLGVTELSYKLNINKSTIYRILQVLLMKGYINQDTGTNKYIIGYKILKMGGTILSRIQLRDIARTNLEKLAIETSQTIRLAILDGQEVVYIDHEEGKDPIRLHLQIGSRGPLHCTAAGKSILAFLKESEVEAILARYNLKAFTANTIKNIADLKIHLKNIRKNGYSFSDEEYTEGIRAVGAPIFNFETRVVGSVVLVSPTFRLKLKEVPAFGLKVKKEAIEISKKMGWPV
jgi:DNA-binding IclR family transcriptional regulator